MLDIATIDKTGKAMYARLRELPTMPPLSVQFPDLTIDDAYNISREFLSHRTISGEKIVGKRIAVTSPAVEEMQGAQEDMIVDVALDLLKQKEASGA
jgi:2-oxopent-4-enoate/cis-2-oxohex-4-enoate hydratase